MTDTADTETTPDEQLDEPNARVDAIISIVIGAAAIWFLLGSQQYVGVSTGPGDPGAAFWPRIILALILLATVANLINIYRRDDVELNTSLFAVDSLGERLKLATESPEMRKFFLTILLIIGYLFVLTELGFIVSTILFVALQLWILGYDSVWKVTLFSVVSTIAIFVLFRSFMNIALPFGTGVFREIGVLIDGLM